MFLHEDSEDSDQTGRMPRLISVFAVRTCRFVGFVVLRLICLALQFHKASTSVLQDTADKVSRLLF